MGDINFTMDLVLKDIGLFQDIAERAGVPIELNPLMIDVFRDAAERYGERAWSDDVIRRLEEATGKLIKRADEEAARFVRVLEEQRRRITSTRSRTDGTSIKCCSIWVR